MGLEEVLQQKRKGNEVTPVDALYKQYLEKNHVKVVDAVYHTICENVANAILQGQKHIEVKYNIPKEGFHLENSATFARRETNNTGDSFFGSKAMYSLQKAGLRTISRYHDVDDYDIYYPVYSITFTREQNGETEKLTYTPDPKLKPFLDRLTELAEKDRIFLKKCEVGCTWKYSRYTHEGRFSGSKDDGSDTITYDDIYSQHVFINQHAQGAYRVGLFKTRHADKLEPFFTLFFSHDAE